MTARSTADQTRAERRTARRRARWEPQPRDWRWAVGTVGKVLIATGTLMFAFVGYQLWGTGLEYAQAQDRLDDEFEDLLAGAAVPTSAVPSPVTTSPVSPTVTSPVTSAVTSPPNGGRPPATTPPTAPPDTVPVPVFAEGDVMARLEIPRVGLDAKVVAGVQPDDLKQGPGHYPGTPMPGQLGNSAIAGHRTTYGQPFFELNEVLPDDEIILTTVQGRFVYRMTGAEVVGPDAGHVVATTEPDVATLTLTTCEPRYTATNRLVVYAQLDVAASGPGLPPVLAYGPEEPTGADAPAAESTTAPVATLAGAPAAGSTAPTVTTPTEPPTTPAGAPATAAEDPADTVAASTADSSTRTASADAFSHGWFSDDAAFGPVALWGLALTTISIGAYLLSRRVRRNWVGALAGIVPFVVALYFFFQNVNRLLPAAI